MMTLGFDRPLRMGAALVALALVSGCAGLNTLSSEVSSFGEWPTDRKPGTFAFERLPSQQARAKAQDAVEDAARGALRQAGFQPVGEGAVPDVLVQVGARATRYEISPWSDPLWWRGGFAHWRYGPWLGPRWSPYWREEGTRVDREVALLIRDRASGKPLYEARASSSGSTSFDPQVMRAMFAAAMKDFPAVGLNPRVVSVPLE
jgi:hypothetical protein